MGSRVEAGRRKPDIGVPGKRGMTHVYLIYALIYCFMPVSLNLAKCLNLLHVTRCCFITLVRMKLIRSSICRGFSSSDLYLLRVIEDISAGTSRFQGF